MPDLRTVLQRVLQRVHDELGKPADGGWKGLRDTDYVELRVRIGLLKEVEAALAEPEQGWSKLTPQTAPRGGAFLVRSFTCPLGPTVRFGGVPEEITAGVSVAYRGTGATPGLWALNQFWPDAPDTGQFGSDLWQEYALIPGVAYEADAPAQAAA